MDNHENDILDDLDLRVSEDTHEIEAIPPEQIPDSEAEQEEVGNGNEEAAGGAEKKAETPEAKSAREKELEAEVERLKAEKQTAEKRAHDNQAAYTKAQQRLKELDRKSDSPEADGWFEDEDGEKGEEPDLPEVKAAEKGEAEELRKQFKRLESEQQRLAAAEAQRQWEAVEAPLKQQHPDYEHVVYEILEPYMQKQDDPVAALILKEFQSKGGTPVAAYALGKRLQAAIEPEAAARVEDQTKTNNGSGKKAAHAAARIAAGNSSPPDRNTPTGYDGNDVIGEVFR